jgi:hypothetical protein
MASLRHVELAGCRAEHQVLCFVGGVGQIVPVEQTGHRGRGPREPRAAVLKGMVATSKWRSAAALSVIVGYASSPKSGP